MHHLRHLRSLIAFAGCALVALWGAGCGAPTEGAAAAARAVVQTPGGRRVSPSARSFSWGLAPTEPEDPGGEPFVIAKFAGPIPAGARSALAEAGYREVSYLPYDALLVERPGQGAAPTIPGLTAWVPYRAEDRVSRDLRSDDAVPGSERRETALMVHIMPGHGTAAVMSAIVARGGRIAASGRAGDFGRVTAVFPTSAVAAEARALGGRSEVFFVERIHHVGSLNSRAVGSIQSGVQGHDMGQTPIWNRGIRGENQIIGIIDTGLDANSCYFDDGRLPVTNTWSEAAGYGTATDPTHRKIAAYDFLFSCDQWPAAQGCESPSNPLHWDTQGHGTHCSGNMAGDSDNDPSTHAAQDGMAPAARIVMQDGGYRVDACGDLPGIGCPVVQLDPIFEQARLQGASIHNNSWGDNEVVRPPGQCNYSARSQDVDRYMWEHKDFLVVYAAGNDGAGGADFSVGSPATNKNGLSVGSSRVRVVAPSDDNISSFSSRGWTADGRIKPDLMAPGCNASAGSNRTVSGPVNCGPDAGCGTSYAAPVVVGAAALVRQYYGDGFYPSGTKQAGDALTPSAALLKATLINSAVSMTGADQTGQAISPIPSHEQGWGRVQLDRSLVFSGEARKLYIDDHREGLPAGATASFTYAVNGVDPTQPLKVTLVWTDYPGTPDSPPPAPSVDDPASWNAATLINDLDLTVTGPDGTFLGNVFQDGASVVGGSVDRRNNVEQVLIPAPPPGDYTITVHAFGIVQAGQDFALVVTGAWQDVGGAPSPTDAGSFDTGEDAP
jgi:hypothetical protein